MIKALEATLAPFVQPEKPQVFPTPAASFINNGPDIFMLEPISAAPPSRTAQIPERRRRYGYAHFDWDFCDDLTQSDRVSRLFKPASAALLDLGMMLLIFTAAPGMPVPIWFAPSQICNMLCTGERALETPDLRTHDWRGIGGQQCC